MVFQIPSVQLHWFLLRRTTFWSKACLPLKGFTVKMNVPCLTYMSGSCGSYFCVVDLSACRLRGFHNSWVWFWSVTLPWGSVQKLQNNIAGILSGEFCKLSVLNRITNTSPRLLLRKFQIFQQQLLKEYLEVAHLCHLITLQHAVTKLN